MIDLLKGRSRKLSLPNGEEHKAYYAIVDLNSIKASHNEISFSNTEGYPVNSNGENINDRNYKGDVSAQNNVNKIAENLNPESLISLSSTPAGTPIIDKNGIVVSGNNRVMSLKLAAKKYPANYEKYKQQLAEDIDAFGFDNYVGTALLMNDSIPLPGSSYNEPLKIKFTHPVLVRVDESLPETLTTNDLAKFNQDSKKGERPLDRAIKLSNILLENDRCRNVILNILNGYDSFTDLYGYEGRFDRKKLIDTFVQCGLIPESQLPSYFDNNEFTEVGKDYIETLLSAIILTPDALRVSSADGVKRLRQIVISSLPLLMTNESLGKASLKNYISWAIIAQYKINQLGDFSDYIRTQSIFAEDKIDEKSLYVNALLRKGRNEFKTALKKYNESVKSNEGESLFNEAKLSPEKIFELTIEASVDPQDKKLIQSIYPENKKNNMAFETELIIDNITSIENMGTLNNDEFLFSDNWYKAYPNKILGTPYESSGRFGSVTKYKGTADLLERIEVSESFIGADKGLINPLASVFTDINISAEIQKPDVQRIVKKAISVSNKEITSIKKKEVIKVDEEAVLMPVAEIRNFRESFFTLNPEISTDELEVYVWHKSSIGKPLSKNYVSIFNPELFGSSEDLRDTYNYTVPEEKITNWVSLGLLFYYKNQLYPAYEYLSGDMYAKQFALKHDKSEIIEKYGELVYENQSKAIEGVFQQVYSRRLMIGGEKSLVLLANSKFAQQFMISRIVDIPEEKKFKIRKVTAASNKDYGKPDLINDHKTSEYQKDEFEELSLDIAFGWWVLNSKPQLKEPISHLDIVKYYVLGTKIMIPADDDTPAAKKSAEAKKERLKSSVQREGERFFNEFLETQLLPNDKVKLETKWNMDYNNHFPVDLNKVPVAFRMAKYVMGKEEVIRPEKRDAVAFTMNNGTGILSYDVGVGKTPSAIFTISAFMDAGYCRHPLIVVPNQVYKQFISEIKMFTPHIPVIEAYNLSKEYAENFRDADGTIKPSPSGAITIMTYEGFENIGFSDTTTNKLIGGLYEILNQGGESEKSEKKKASFQERIEALVGKGLKGGMYSVEEFGFDFICYDEAHKMKKVFTSVKGESEEGEDGKTTRGRNPYAITSGSPSSIALKGFMVNYYILQQNNYKNILLLTATPFTNSPLEIFSMLSMVAYEQLQNTNLNNLKTFFDTYIKASNELVINSKLKPQFKQVILGFNNLISLQLLIRRFILYKTGEDVNIQRPKKYVLPYLKTIENGIIVNLPEDKKVETYISMTPQQQAMMDDIIDYVENGSNLASKSYGDDEGEEVIVDDEEITDETQGVDVDEDSLDDNEKLGVRTIKGLSYSRNVALSPYLYEHSGLGTPNSRQYIETSPKLLYVMNCIRSVREYHLFKGTPVSGQVIYMDRGIKYFNLIKEYLINEIGYAPHEVGVIQSGLPKNGVRSKEYVKNLMNGEIYNEKTKEFEPVPDKDRIKVVIGSSTIKEGINLQKYSTVLYNCFIDWNPTDIQQLEGRIYRQKNTFDAVRITNPLVVDSADIFLFQKLQEKTARLNTIWSTDGKSNVLHTEELNPEELKYALIKNPRIIAELRIIEQKARFQSDILGVKRQKEIAERVMAAASTLNYRYPMIIEALEDYRDFKPTGDKIEDSIKLLQITNDLEKKQTDKQGKKIFDEWEWKYLDDKEKEKVGDNRSPMPSKFRKPYWFSDFALAARDMKRYMNDFINQYKIRFDIDNYKLSLEDFIHKIDSQVEVIENKIKELANKEYVDNLVREAIEEKERQKITYKPLMAVVKDFAKLNYLLDLTKVIKLVEAPIYNTCPPMDSEGRFAIDPVAIKYLESCIMNMPQTKSLHYNEETQQYLPKRERLHEEIIDDIFEDVKCVANHQPIAIFTGGSPASGKSYFIKKNAKYLDDDNIFKLDADEIRSKLPEYEGWNANTTHLETQDIVNNLLNRIGSESCRYDLIYDGTMNKAKKYFELIKKVRDLGYKVYIIFMDIPYHEAKKRALLRYQRSGRYVPMEVIDDFFTDINGKSKGQTALDELKPLVDGYVVADGVSGEIIEQGGEGLPGKRDKGVYADSKPKLIGESSSNVLKDGFTEGKQLNKMFADLKNKYGDKKGSQMYDVANRLVNPNKNTIVEIRSNGVVVKEGDKFILKTFGNTDANSKKWILYQGLDVTDQFANPEKTNGSSKLKLSDIPENVKAFMPVMQQKAIVGSEEHFDTISELSSIIENMPKTYDTENIKNDEKVVYLHYFYGQSDWYIVEKDMEREQLQAFGYVILNGDTEMAEWGYINIEELKKTNRVELDFYFTPIAFGELKKTWQDEEPEVKSNKKFKVEVHGVGDPKDHYVSNALEFDTKDEAEKYGNNLAGRWSGMDDWRVVEIEQPDANSYKFDAGAVSLKSDDSGKDYKGDNFWYGRGGFGNTLQDSFDLKIQLDKLGFIIINQNKDSLVITKYPNDKDKYIKVYDNGGEFNLTHDGFDFINAVAYDYNTVPYGLNRTIDIAKKINNAYNKFFKINNGSTEEIINPNTDEEFNEAVFEQVDPSDEWIGHLIKERAIKKQLSEIVKGATPEDIEKLFYEYKDWFIKKQGGTSPSVKKITTKESTLKLIATLKTALKFSKGENKKTIQKRIKALELSTKYLN
jgi:predicted kinase